MTDATWIIWFYVASLFIKWNIFGQLLKVDDAAILLQKAVLRPLCQVSPTKPPIHRRQARSTSDWLRFFHRIGHRSLQIRKHAAQSGLRSLLAELRSPLCAGEPENSKQPLSHTFAFDPLKGIPSVKSAVSPDGNGTKQAEQPSRWAAESALSAWLAYNLQKVLPGRALRYRSWCKNH